EQQAQTITLLQSQIQTYEFQAQTIADLQARIQRFEQFHQQIANCYSTFHVEDNQSPTPSSDSTINF
ncbi:17436_t:CDS:1, partial [Racocetra persica]